MYVQYLPYVSLKSEEHKCFVRYTITKYTSATAAADDRGRRMIDLNGKEKADNKTRISTRVSSIQYYYSIIKK